MPCPILMKFGRLVVPWVYRAGFVINVEKDWQDGTDTSDNVSLTATFYCSCSLYVCVCVCLLHFYIL